MAAHEQTNGISAEDHVLVDGATADADVVSELLGVVPRWVDRTRSQAEFARMLAAMLPCVGALVPGRRAEPGPGVPEHERVDVLTVLRQDSDARAQDTVPSATEAAVATPAATTADTTDTTGATGAPALSEAELPIQDYDSLAASQVVPRLATLAPDDLVVVQRYEGANRRRQTILNRVAQLLGG